MTRPTIQYSTIQYNSTAINLYSEDAVNVSNKLSLFGVKVD